VLVAALWSGGCGYALAGRGSFLPDYIRTIGVPTFANRTSIFNLETQLTQKIRSEFIGRGKFQTVPDTTNVDAVLTGEITSARSEVSSLSAQQLASRYAVIISARVELRDLRENKVIWENANLTFREDYEAQSGTGVLDPNAFFGQDANALDRLSSDFARTVVSAILEAF
jgi:hypothetical protein